MKNEDVNLIQHILSGDEGAFTALMERHLANLRLAGGVSLPRLIADR